MLFLSVPKGTRSFSSFFRELSKVTDTKYFSSTFKHTVNAQTIFYSFFLSSRYINFYDVTSLIMLVDTASRAIHSLFLFNVTAAGLDLCLFKKVSPSGVFSSV